MSFVDCCFISSLPCNLFTVLGHLYVTQMCVQSHLCAVGNSKHVLHCVRIQDVAEETPVEHGLSCKFAAFALLEWRTKMPNERGHKDQKFDIEINK